jgi:riboflavin biosynthesis pyrimidine reductase
MVEIVSLLPDLAGELDDIAVADHYSIGAGTPWVRVNFVSSIDGAATVQGKSGGLGGEADHRVFDLLRTLCDVIVVGSGTVAIEGYGAMILDEASVAMRVAAGLAPQPAFAIVSGSLELDPAAEVFTRAPVRPIVITMSSAPPNDALAAVADVVVCGSTSVDLAAMVSALTDRKLALIHSEGGPTLLGSMLAADVVDELCVTVSPLLVSGNSGRIARGALPEPRRMSLAGILRSDDALMLRYLRDR